MRWRLSHAKRILTNRVNRSRSAGARQRHAVWLFRAFWFASSGVMHVEQPWVGVAAAPGRSRARHVDDASRCITLAVVALPSQESPGDVPRGTQSASGIRNW